MEQGTALETPAKPPFEDVTDVCLKHANSSHHTVWVYTSVEKPRENRAREPCEPGRESVRDAVGVVGTLAVSDAKSSIQLMGLMEWLLRLAYLEGSPELLRDAFSDALCASSREQRIERSHAEADPPERPAPARVHGGHTPLDRDLRGPHVAKQHRLERKGPSIRVCDAADAIVRAFEERGAILDGTEEVVAPQILANVWAGQKLMKEALSGHQRSSRTGRIGQRIGSVSS